MIALTPCQKAKLKTMKDRLEREKNIREYVNILIEFPIKAFRIVFLSAAPQPFSSPERSPTFRIHFFCQ